MRHYRIALAAGISLLAIQGQTAMAQVDDIVVTARKATETLQDVPVSVAPSTRK